MIQLKDSLIRDACGWCGDHSLGFRFEDTGSQRLYIACLECFPKITINNPLRMRRPPDLAQPRPGPGASINGRRQPPSTPPNPADYYIADEGPHDDIYLYFYPYGYLY